MRKTVTVGLIIALVVVGSVSTYYYVTIRDTCAGSGEPISYNSTFSFNMTSALRFYTTLMTPLRLATDYLGSHTIWLADDQALDYTALLRTYFSAGNSTAVGLATDLNNSIIPWGGFYKYWNPVFEVLGRYPNSTQVMAPETITVDASDSGYEINATQYVPDSNYAYSSYADQLAYRALLFLHDGNYCRAESFFRKMTTMWNLSNGQGFVDNATGTGNSTYATYKLALYLIAWKQFAANTATQTFAAYYEPTVQNVTALMSELQSPTGGVWTSYGFSAGVLGHDEGNSSVNGETTSLFVLAAT